MFLRLAPYAALAAILSATPLTASAQTGAPTKSQVCLDVSGETLPIVCKVPGGQLDRREDICSCPEGRLVDIAVCGPNETPPADDVEYARARKLAATDGTLIGDMYEGRRMCIAPRRP